MIRFQQRSGDGLFPEVTLVPLPQGSVGSTTPGTLEDLTTENTSLSSAWNDYLVESTLPIEDSFSIQTLDESISDSSAFPVISKVSSGIGRVRLTYGGATKTLQLDHRTEGGSESVAVTGFQSSTIGAYSWAIIEPLLITGGDLTLLHGGTGTDFSAATYNPSCWSDAFDFSGVPHWNSYFNASNSGGALITNRHILYATHYTPNVGSQVTFIAPDGTKTTKTILGFSDLWKGPSSGSTTKDPIAGDRSVAVLDSAVPGTIATYPVVGEWIRKDGAVDSLDRPNWYQAFVGVKLNRQRQVLLAGRTDTYGNIYGYQSGSYYGQSFTDFLGGVNTDWGPASYLPDFLTSYSSYYAQSIGGDSGTPRFFPLTSSTLALVGCVTGSSGSASFPDETLLNLMIQSADANGGVSTGLAVTVAPDPTI